ncbi:MAG: amino acid--tRNA ligase-related protein, partial [Bdellovibrionota bacterium]
MISLGTNRLGPMQILKDWADFHWEIRNFFREQKFLEVITPTVVSCPGTEPAIEPFQTSLKQGSVSVPMFLRTSPELKIKRLLSAEVPRIFEIATVFRNEEYTPIHKPEFQMLEWYRANEPLEQLETDVEALIEALLRRFHRAEQLPVFTRQTVRDFLSEALGVVIESHWGT